MELYISTIKEFIQKGEIVDSIIDNLHLIHDNKDSREYVINRISDREYIMRNPDMTEEAKLVYLQIDMPKFVWVTEISDKKSFLNNKVNCLILLDATGSNIDNEGYSSLLFYQKRDVGTFFNKKNRWFENIPLSLPSLFEAFNDNLK